MTNLRKIVQEELHKLVAESTEKAPALEKKLTDLKAKLTPDRNINTGEKNRRAKSIEVATVAELLDVKINELILYFLNNVKTMNDPPEIEYSVGSIVFYFD